MVLLIFLVIISSLVWGKYHSLPVCSPTTLRLTDFSNNSIWQLEPDGTFSLSFDHCQVRRILPAEAKQCLKGNHILFLGDSVTRYMYISLVTFLSANNWGSRISHSTNAKYPRNANKTWSEYFYQTNKLLNHDGLSFELCDCYREDIKFSLSDPHFIENRYYRIYGDGDNDSEPVQVSYIQYYGPAHMRGRSSFTKNAPRDCKGYRRFLNVIGYAACPMGKLKGTTLPYVNNLVPIQGNCSKSLLSPSPAFKLDYPQLWDDFSGNFERKLLSILKVTNIILNLGHHAPICARNKSNEVVTEQERTLWMRTRVEQSQKYLSPIQGNNLKLPQVTWRSGNAYARHAWANDDIAYNLHFNYEADKENRYSLGYMDIFRVTERLLVILDSVQKNGGHLDVNPYLNLSTPDLKLLPFVVSPEYRKSLLFSNASRVVPISATYADLAHPEPFAYNELNNAFLNAICKI